MRRARRVGGEPVRKITVSLSAPAVAAAQADMRARGVPTISAYLDELVRERASEGDLRAVLDRLIGDQPITADERAWADRAFRG
jgi:hypothetical protein